MAFNKLTYGLNQLSGAFGSLRSGASVPAAPSGSYFAAIPNPAYCTTDTAGGTPCADGDLIRWWKDAVSGTWSEQATSGSRWTLKLDPLNKWYALTSGSSRHTFTGVSTNRRNFSIGLALRPTGGLTGQNVWADATSPFALQNYVGSWATFDNANLRNSNLAVTPVDAAISLESSATETVFKVSGVSATRGVIAAGTNTNLVLGDYASGGVNAVGRLYGAVAYNSGTLSDGLRASRDAWLASLMPVYTKLVIWDGNSFVAGNGLTASQRMPAVLQTNAGVTWLVIPFGVSGQTTAQMQADAATQIDIYWTPSTALGKVIVGTEGTNSIFFGASAATAYSQMSTFLTDRLAAGAGEAGFTDIIPRSEFDAPKNVERAAYNALIDTDFNRPHPTNPYVWYRAIGSTHPARWVLKESLRTAFATTASSGFQGDGIHPSVTGAAFYAADVQDAITGSP